MLPDSGSPRRRAAKWIRFGALAFSRRDVPCFGRLAGHFFLRWRMRPDGFRRRLGFALCGAATLTLLSAVPTLAQGLSASSMMGSVPLAIALGAGAFGLLSLALI